MDKESYKEASFYGSLDEIINYLKNAENNEEKVYIDFGSENGVIRLYSSDVDENNIYLRIYGLTKKQKNNFDNELSVVQNLNDDIITQNIKDKYETIKDEYFSNLKMNAKKVEFNNNSLFDIINALNEYKKLGDNVYIEYQSTSDDDIIKLYSIDFNIDKTFMSIMGITKSQYDENKDRFKMAESDDELQMVITDLYQIMEQNKKR